MIFSVFDNDVEALSLWRRVAAANDLQFLANHDFEEANDDLAGDPQIIVLDQSIVYGDIRNVIATCCKKYRQHLFIATGRDLSVQHAVQLIQNCAVWVFEKPLNPNEIQQAMPNIVEVAGNIAEKLMEYRRLQTLFERLTSREKAVLELILDGTSNKDAATLLEISIRTVEARRAKVYLKTGNENVVGLIQMVVRLQQLRRRFEPLIGQLHNSVLHHHLRIAEGTIDSSRRTDDDLNLASM